MIMHTVMVTSGAYWHLGIFFVFSSEIELLSNHGILLPPNMQGMTEEQVRDLKLVDEYADKIIPSGGFVENPDPVGRRNGQGKFNSHNVISNGVLLMGLQLW